ncbi:aldehyde dehydrogenase family protein [Catenuloplanes atrovinosus]|uniref:Glyceraldehyde-3-phosphate dehydrogenase (NADP+) n=1 Tax=Catenuloplanes atrovinosus TaxID=137266 RepID=A0AAE4CCG9_9ACTN|nr:aldehyde dehydrogenase family protein [Catenuloplanes atrovinosus]MDR7279178.1 glyceraldehyde-3-phosphate dehydrogenase (NADP+) [Catenuloplanes atrovinosus]
MDITPFYLAGQPAHGRDEVVVRHPYDGAVVGRTTFATPEQVDEALNKAVLAPAPAHVRATALDHVSQRLRERADEVARLITAENGKPLKWARAEAARAVSVFRWAAEESRRFAGEMQRLDTDPAGEGRMALVRRVPRGAVLGISPFNFPLNLVAHKVAPAIAVGAPIVLKPAPATPLSALLLGELLAETDLPEGAFSVLPLPNDRTAELVRDPRLPVVSFTGSGPVGGLIQDSVPRKHVTLELGGNAAVVICADWSSDEDVAHAASRVAVFSNYQAGQSCIAVQRVYVHADVHDRFVASLVERVRELRTGDPADEATDVGPLISEDAAKRVEAWVDEAVAAGAEVLAGGKRDGCSYAPTILTNVPPGAKVLVEEVFGPVLAVQRVSGDEEAFAAVNDSAYGLQAGVFTHSLRTAFAAHQTLQVGGVIIGDVPSYRADQMPYGGVKGSGVGREGLRSAMEDYTEPRVMVLTGLAL